MFKIKPISTSRDGARLYLLILFASHLYNRLYLWSNYTIFTPIFTAKAKIASDIYAFYGIINMLQLNINQSHDISLCSQKIKCGHMRSLNLLWLRLLSCSDCIWSLFCLRPKERLHVKRKFISSKSSQEG